MLFSINGIKNEAMDFDGYWIDMGLIIFETMKEK